MEGMDIIIIKNNFEVRKIPGELRISEVERIAREAEDSCRNIGFPDPTSIVKIIVVTGKVRIGFRRYYYILHKNVQNGRMWMEIYRPGEIDTHEAKTIYVWRWNIKVFTLMALSIAILSIGVWILVVSPKLLVGWISNMVIGAAMAFLAYVAGLEEKRDDR